MHDLVYFYPEGHERHAAPQHPERPERITAIVQALQTAGYWDAYPKLSPLDYPHSVLAGVHSPAHLHRLEQKSRAGSALDPDTYLTPASWPLAINAAGGAVAAALAVWERDARRGFALTRPPGHHATRERAMGFCLINNIAVAAEALIRLAGAKKLAIIDLDLHHGNGTQDIFYERPDVFFMSTHQAPLYPGTGGLYETGVGPGARHTLNLPFPPYSGDQAFTQALDKIILPILDRYAPEMILVSFGVDPHWRDPLGNLLLSAGGYGQLIAKLTAWADAHCKGRIALFLEGGYDLDGAAACAVAAVAALCGQPFSDSVGAAPWAEQAGWRDVLYRAALHWDLPGEF